MMSKRNGISQIAQAREVPDFHRKGTEDIAVYVPAGPISQYKGKHTACRGFTAQVNKLGQLPNLGRNGLQVTAVGPTIAQHISPKKPFGKREHSR